MKQAIKLAIKAMEIQRRRYAFDANLYIAGIVSERTSKAYEEYSNWAKAIDAIEALKHDCKA